MKESLEKFKESSFYSIVTIVFPVAAVVATVLLYLNSEALRDQAAQHRVELLTFQGSLKEKESQIVLLNEQIKQKSTQSEILKTQVDLLQKINNHHEVTAQIDLNEIQSELDLKSEQLTDLRRKLVAYEEISGEYGEAEAIAETISELKESISNLELKNLDLTSRIKTYEPLHPNLASFELKEGESKTLLNNSLTIGLIDAYGSWGYINSSHFQEELFEREQIEVGKNISLVFEGSHYVLIVDSISQTKAKFTLVASGK